MNRKEVAAGFRSPNTGTGIMAVVFALLSIGLLSGCKTKTDAVPIGEVGIEFVITLNERETIDYQGRMTDWRTFHLSGNLFTIADDGYTMVLALASDERLVLFDGESEYTVRERPTLFQGDTYVVTSGDGVRPDAPYYVLRYYRRDGEMLESRIETPVLPEFIAPERESEWLSRAQVLGVKWTPTEIPVLEIVLHSICRLSVDDEAMRFPVSGTTQLNIDLTTKPHEEACNAPPPRRTHINLVQMPVSASSIDSRFLGESRFELQRNRERHIRERT